MHQKKLAPQSGGSDLKSETKNSMFQPTGSDDVLALCHMFANRIGKVFASELAKYDVTIAEWRVILSLHKNVSGQEITRRWAMDKMAVNRAIASLEQRGLIKKVRNDKDRRIIDLSLTRSGQALYEKLLPVANARYRRLMMGLDKSETKLLREILIKMIIHADSIDD
ncbi:MAG: MarR family transcriptional regulator [Xanthobacteraceae bacterium]|nr:MAG: MarR family transcriptional regulator [Xanthobacteraceae bacterium]